MTLYAGDGKAQTANIGGEIFTDRGTGVRVKVEDFLSILSKNQDPLVIVTSEGLFTKIYKYITAYKGFVFFTESLDRLDFNSNTEIIYAQNLSSNI
jgi:hypothetical protein